MLLAYIDEIGEPGAFVARDHARFNTSPAFGYAGFVIPETNARRFGTAFTEEKRRVFKTEIERAANPGQWERKGSSIFRPDTMAKFPQQIRVFNGLVRTLRALGGSLFYYADEKPIGTPAQTRLDTAQRETAAMQETLNRLARHSESQDGSNLMVMIDQINENQRSERVPNMYAHILGRASSHPEMRRIIEPPMHVDSVLSANIQFADWVSACVTRAIEFQIRDSPYRWVTGPKAVDAVRGSFTRESKLRLWKRSVPDLNHSEVFRSERPLHPTPDGQLLGSSIPDAALRKLRAGAQKRRQPGM
ncbi:DUF3800 domain-containing protein [Agrococcus sp. Marseille-Q4369]|uniref:DUF3800 domain-containing protein n=1 Tax=Agrococcus sp. Marseille-Q4369 TaxID=2810513 RepID=UPI001B8A969F|nr:DUF3800 domain-containing protein [Agrococcus sp. Marseille-Q4369]QUW19791.1 DUF3800 domain-containing protein [Agrococcus sp. Marseille-Q4369]